MTKQEIREVIDKENGEGFSNNINLNGYVFIKNESFIIFEFKYIEDILVCHIKYIYYTNEKDLINVLVYCCNFWMGNKVQFIFYKEKFKKNSAVKFLKDLNFRVEIVDSPKWKFKFDCIEDGKDCHCILYNFYK